MASRGKLFILLLTFFLCTMKSVHAFLPETEFALGGIPLGTYKSQVTGIYGPPSFIENNGTETYYYYGNSLKFCFHNESGRLISILTTANNGISTPSGIHVGTSIQELKSTYGYDFTSSDDYISYNSGIPFGPFLFFRHNGSQITLINLELHT